VSSVLTRAEADLLREIISRGSPSSVTLVDALLERRLTDDERDELRQVVADELVSEGLRDDDEPNEYGHRLERFIDALGHH
jgi:hypothetical protein